MAVQLSHNSIFGKDDPVILKELWEELDTVDLKEYAGLDDKVLKELAAVDISSVSEAKIDYRMVTFLFLPEEADRLKQAFAQASETVAADDVFVLPAKQFEGLVGALDKSKAAFNVHNHAVAFMLLVAVLERHWDELADGWASQDETKHAGMVPLATVLGTDKVPSKLALELKRLVESLVAAGQISKMKLWQVLERLVAGESQELS